MIQRYKFTTQLTPTLNGGYDVVAIAVPDDQGDYVRHDAVSHLTEEKTVEQHRAEFEEWVASEFKGGVLDKEMIARYAGNNDLYHHAQTSQLWRAWQAARGLKP